MLALCRQALRLPRPASPRPALVFVSATTPAKLPSRTTATTPATSWAAGSSSAVRCAPGDGGQRQHIHEHYGSARSSVEPSSRRVPMRESPASQRACRPAAGTRALRLWARRSHCCAWSRCPRPAPSWSLVLGAQPAPMVVAGIEAIRRHTQSLGGGIEMVAPRLRAGIPQRGPKCSTDRLPRVTPGWDRAGHAGGHARAGRRRRACCIGHRSATALVLAGLGLPGYTPPPMPSGHGQAGIDRRQFVRGCRRTSPRSPLSTM